MAPGGRRAAGGLPRPSGVITLLTDFGWDDPYVAVVKGVILGIHPRARLVDITHTIPPQDVLRGALALAGAYRFFPKGTVHLAVVDPGVGGARRALLVAADGHYFVGPDNGLLGFLFDRPGARAVALTNPRYHRPAVSRTFHARDVFGPVAAYCARGVPPGRFGPPVTDPRRPPWPGIRRRGGVVEGRVLLADRFGNLLTSVTADDLPGPADACVVEVGGRRVPLVGSYSDRPRGALGAVVDSSGRVEVFVRDGSARDRLGVGPGRPVRIWCPGSRTTRTPGSRWSRARPPSSPPPGPSSATLTGSR